MSKSKFVILTPLVLAALVGLGYYWWTQVRFIESTDNAYVENDISNISVKVPGYVVLANVSDNQHVVAGQLLAQLEESQFVAKVKQSDAILASAKANLQTLAAKVDLQQALISQARSGVVAAAADPRREGLAYGE